MGTFLVVSMVVFGAFSVLCLLSFWKVDAVIAELYRTDRPRWRELGSPTGYFWRPEEKVPFFQSVQARDAIQLTALFSPHTLRRPAKENGGESRTRRDHES